MHNIHLSLLFFTLTKNKLRFSCFCTTCLRSKERRKEGRKQLWEEGIENKEEGNCIVRCFPALAFLPTPNVVDAFEELIEDSIPQELISYLEGH